MTYLDPFQGQQYDPILTTLPDTLKAFANKYSDPEVASYVDTLPPPIRNPLMDMDRQRVLRGQQPFSKKQLAQAAQTALTGEPYTKPPGKKATNVFGNVLSDIGAITTSIPRIPSALLKEARDLENIPTDIQKAKGPADYFKLPGVRLIPGAYTAGNILGGRAGIQEALTHPVFTALDVLPAAEATGLNSAIAGSRVGEAARVAKQAVKRTRAGQFAEEAVGKTARQTAHMQEIASGRVREILNPHSKALTDADIAGNPLEVAARSASALDSEFPSITKDRRREITTQMQMDRNLITDPTEVAYLNRYEDILGEYEKIGLAEGEFLNIDGEIYDKQTGGRLLKAKNAADEYARAWAGKGPQSERKAAQLQRTYEKLQAKAVPARFRPQVQARLADQIKLTYGTPENIAKVTQAIAEKNYRAIPGWDAAEYNRMTREVEQTWQQMRDVEGIEPMFVHHVDPSQEATIRYPKILEKAKSLSQAHARVNDATPYVQDATVALTHQGLEWLSRRGSEDFAHSILDSFGKSYDDIAEELRPLARKRAARDPSKDVAGHLQDLIRREYTTFDPTGYIQWKSPRVTALAEDQRLIPKTVANNIRRMHSPMKNGLTATIDPVMGVFRTAVLPLSPRWHLNNVFGGGIAAAVEAPGSFRWMGKAQELVRKGETTINGEVFRLPEEMRIAQGGSSRVHQEFALRSGFSQGRLLNEANAARANGLIKGVRQGFGNVVSKSFEANAWMDDTYRAAAYLDGYFKKGANGKVLSTAEREAAGMALSKKVLQTWTDLTPMERSVMRYVFPFYGFMQHITRFALRYPMDHPFRASVMGALARTELDDLGTTLPEKFLNNFFLGKPDENGNVRSIQFGGMNPFRDVSNYFTFAGLLGQTNPIAATIAQQLGLDTQTGAPELYPNLRFDAETGRLGVKSTNPLQALIENTLPQTRVLTGLAQSGSEFKELMSRDPDAAARLMRSQLGLPVLFRDVNVTKEQAKAEFARGEGQQTALREALRSGKDEEARRYAALGPLLDQIRTLQGEGQLEQFKPTVSVPSALTLAQQAIVRQNAP